MANILNIRLAVKVQLYGSQHSLLDMIALGIFIYLFIFY